MTECQSILWGSLRRLEWVLKDCAPFSPGMRGQEPELFESYGIVCITLRAQLLCVQVCVSVAARRDRAARHQPACAAWAQGGSSGTIRRRQVYYCQPYPALL